MCLNVPPRADPPGRYTPLDRYPPSGQVHPPTPGRYTPPEQTHPPPPPGSRLRHTVNERPVRILLESILVMIISHGPHFVEDDITPINSQSVQSKIVKPLFEFKTHGIVLFLGSLITHLTEDIIIYFTPEKELL